MIIIFKNFYLKFSVFLVTFHYLQLCNKKILKSQWITAADTWCFAYLCGWPPVSRNGSSQSDAELFSLILLTLRLRLKRQTLSTAEEQGRISSLPLRVSTWAWWRRVCLLIFDSISPRESHDRGQRQWCRGHCYESWKWNISNVIIYYGDCFTRP